MIEHAERLASAMRDALRIRWRRLRTRVNQWRGTELRYELEIDVPRVSLGALDGRWTFCPRPLTADSIIYSVGVGTDISFDLACIARTGAHIHAFDPTPRSLAWVRTQQLPERFVFHPWGIAAHDGVAAFEPPASAEHVSFRIAGSSAPPRSTVECPVFRLATIMERLGHQRVDLLKLDVEGAELSVIPEILGSGVDVRQLLVEFHHRGRTGELQQTREIVSMLYARGYRIFDVSPNAQEIAWLRI